ncbi:MAG TPA: alpha/beta fold hydrolase [Candidatus Nanoarchaeia archaeon]|nr:alpha/beta fold hydrolase [Candidatus Nanoarchaeia archaeon]
MAGIKQFLKKYELWIIIAATLLFVYVILFFNQKLNFFLGNELVVYLTPEQQSFSLHYGGTKTVNFNISTENIAYCKSYCSYSFTDRSRNEVLDKNSFEIGVGQNAAKSYNLSAKRLGSGQDIYNFEVKCSSIPSFFCHTSSPEKSRSSLVLVNYDLTETEKELKKGLKGNFTMLLELLQNVDVAHQKASQKYFELAHALNLNNLTKEKIEIDDSFDKTRVSIENLRSLWSVENYAQLKLVLNESYFGKLSEIKNRIDNLSRRIGNTAGLHNSILLQLNNIYSKFNELNQFIKISNNTLSSDFNSDLNNFNNLSDAVTNNTFDNYDSVASELDKIKSGQNLIIEKTKASSAKLFFESEYLLDFENSLLCELQENCVENSSLDEITGKMQYFLDDYPQSAYLKNSCTLIKELSQTHADIRNQSLQIIRENNIIFTSDGKFINLTESFRNNKIAKINNSYYDSLQKLKNENKTNTDIIKTAEEFLPLNKVSIAELNYSQPANISLYILSKISLSSQSDNFLNTCSKFENAGQIPQSFDFTPVSTNITYKIVQNVDTTLSDNPPVCCVFNDCKPCCNDVSCRSDPKTFPVIFVHGHAFSKDNSPEYSLDAFNKMQSKLEEDGYLNAGIVSLYSKNEPLQSGIWSLSGKPITVKVSYYYDAFRKNDKYIVVPTKSENIDTYALRLKELVDIVKDRTGKPKVNIIAHSMGGLVVRRYMQIFSPDDVNKFIMIATPNKGVSSKTASYCGYVGENRECQDMLQDSLFINKLNDPSSQPAGVKMYNIIGTGCSTDSSDGDGIVTAENAKSDNAKIDYVNGTCSGLFGGTLHTDILNIDLYSQTYRIVKGILNE